MSRNVFITGASSGIGKAIAYAFGKNGDDLILCARRIGKLEEIKADIERRFGVNVYIFELYVTKYDKVVKTVKKILEKVSKVDILVNNAGLALGL